MKVYNINAINCQIRNQISLWINGYIRIGVFNFQQRDVENLNDSAIRVPSDTICTQMAKNYTMNL